MKNACLQKPQLTVVLEKPVNQESIPTCIDEATIEQIVFYDFQNDLLMWCERPLHWFSTENRGHAWNRTYANQPVGKGVNLYLCGKGIRYVLTKNTIVGDFWVLKHDPEDKTTKKRVSLPIRQRAPSSKRKLR